MTTQTLSLKRKHKRYQSMLFRGERFTDRLTIVLLLTAASVVLYDLYILLDGLA